MATLDTAAVAPQMAALWAERTAHAAKTELVGLMLGHASALANLDNRAEAARDDARLTLAQIELQKVALSAKLDGVAVRQDKSCFASPFDARVGARLADPGQTVVAWHRPSARSSRRNGPRPGG